MEELRRLTGPRTKAILVNTPGNPTGAVFPAAVMQALAEHAAATGTYLISDEIYEDMVFSAPHVSAADFDIHDRLFVVAGVSKSYAMTGFRLGFLVCPVGLGPVAASLQEPVTSCASTPSQKAAEAALSGDQSAVARLCATFRRRAELFVSELGPGLVPVAPAGAFYTLVDIAPTGLGSLEFCKLLLSEDAVAAVPGITFGPSCDRTVRVAFSASDTQLVVAAARMRRRIEALSGGRPPVSGEKDVAR
jgi:aspartate aminotransferase/aminotransferase